MKRILISFTVGAVIGLVLGAMLGHKWPPGEEQVVDYMTHLSLPELASLNKNLAAKSSGLQVFQTQILPPPSPVPAAPGK
jgi:hypothetical protein